MLHNIWMQRYGILWEQTNNHVLFYSYAYKITQNHLLCATKSQVPASLLLWFKVAHSLKVTFSHTLKQARKACKYHINVLQNASNGKKRFFKITPPNAKNALQNTINIDREHPWPCCPKTFILLTVYMQHSLSFLHPNFRGAKRLLSTERKVVEARTKPRERGKEPILKPHTSSPKKTENTTNPSSISK